jgi:hypothetical protein
VSIDETTDVSGTFVANVVVVGMLKDDQPADIFLLACEVLEKVNNSFIAVVFDNAMNLLWPKKVQRENVLMAAHKGPKQAADSFNNIRKYSCIKTATNIHNFYSYRLHNRDDAIKDLQRYFQFLVFSSRKI